MEKMDELLESARIVGIEVEFLHQFYSIMKSAVKLDVDQNADSITSHAEWILSQVKKTTHRVNDE
ncbi:hypothetical protein ACW2QC_07660 [Virgibacillus sp. FSP13]